MYIGGRPGAIEACGMSLKQAKRQSSGNATFEKTADLRNLDLSPLSEAIRQVATCYQKRGDDENRSKALGLLQQINTNEGFFAGLSAEERHALQLQIKSLRPSGSDLTPAAEQVPVIKSMPATKLALSKVDSQLLGSWRSDTGTIINGGDDKALNGKKIAGTVDITIGEGEMTINSVMATKLPIAFVTNDDRAKAAFKSEIAAGGKNYAIIKFLSSGILEHFAISGDGKALDSTRIVPSIRTDGEARAQRITRTWLRAK
jgi:hypothetical protein